MTLNGSIREAYFAPRGVALAVFGFFCLVSFVCFDGFDERKSLLGGPTSWCDSQHAHNAQHRSDCLVMGTALVTVTFPSPQVSMLRLQRQLLHLEHLFR